MTASPETESQETASGRGVGRTEAPLVAVLDYGIGNLRSAQKALQFVGADARSTTDRALIEAADAVVLPGVGAFGACMDALHRSGLAEAAQRAAASSRPFLGICVGMQLLFEASEEAPGVRGLGIFSGTVRRLPAGVKRPQMQWNRLVVTGADPLLRGLESDSWMYFVHSYAAEPSDDVMAVCEYGGTVPAVLRRANVSATQFHPEKSGKKGLHLLRNFVADIGRPLQAV